MYECTCGATYLSHIYLVRHINGVIPRYPTLKEVKVHEETLKSKKAFLAEEVH